MRPIWTTITTLGIGATLGGALMLAVPVFAQSPSPISPEQTALVDPVPCPSNEPTMAPGADTPLPLAVVDSGFSVNKDGRASYAVIIGNPNESRWLASYKAVTIELADANGDLLGSADENVTILPGNQTAIVGSFDDANKKSVLTVQIDDDPNDWSELDFVPGDLEFTGVKTKKGDFGSKTTGRVSSTYAARQESVEVQAVYRDKGGKIIGGDYTYVDFVPAGGRSSFEISAFGELPTVGATEMYYESPYELDNEIYR